MLDLLVHTFTDHFGRTAADLGPGTRLDELEVDSIVLLELLTVLHDQHGLRVPDGITALRGNPTLGEVTIHLQSVQPTAGPAPAPAMGADV
ncbi:acyl carrier protein [Streptomyces sp. NPDC012794]|uniref:acyl carrier protein n=1 Tax=Streptomyces sp. NPDC012794 TaxID=3364850 RepID=UPI0036D20615